MKKLIFTAIALCVGLIGYAQVTDLDGKNSPNATVIGALPGAGAGANTGLSIQNGDDNRVRVRQAGTSQSAYTVQDNGSGLGGNQALVRQTGQVNAGSGILNVAETRQSGTENSSITLQEGDKNESVTRQGQLSDDGSERNKARIQQGVADQAEENFAAIDQDGDDNQASTLQTYDNSDAWTQQVGNENKSMIIQDAGPNQTDGHYASVQQMGDRNESAVEQQGNGGRNTAYARQDGDDNQSKQWQNTSAGSGGTGNDANVTQGITTPQVPLIQTLLSDVGNIDPNGLPIFGSSGLSIGAGAKQTQYGKMNSAAIRQFGGTVGASNYAEQEQLSGWSNTAAIEQGHYYVGEAGNYAKQSQAGDNNDAGLAQSGSGHKGLQTQYGHHNDVVSNQRGANHLLNTHQRGNRNRATTAQGGDGNAALVVQRHGQSYSVEQNLDLATLDRSAGGNQADILQLGPNGDFGHDAIPCDFDDPMDLDMDYSVDMLDLGDVCPGC